MQSVLIVGGYGAVGKRIALSLTRQPLRIVIAGRDLTKAQAAAATMGALAQRVDLTDPTTWDAALAGIQLVIACIDQTGTSFLAAVTERGIAYLDVTANDGFFAQAEQLKPASPVLLSVGLAPGLSNLLATAAAQGLDSVSRIEIGLLMGLGDEHGKAAIDWSMRNVFDPAAKRDTAIVDFGPDFGRRRAYFMDFSDQHALERTMPGTAVTTRVAYDSAVMTNALFWLGRTFAGNGVVERVVTAIGHMPSGGSDKCVLSVTVTGQRNGFEQQHRALYRGRQEAAVTAETAALMARAVLDGEVPAGVWHSHQIVRPDAIFNDLERRGHGTFELPSDV